MAIKRIRVWWKAAGLLAWASLALALEAGVGQRVAAEPPLTAEQKARLQERDRYDAEAKKLWDAGQHTDAIAAFKKAVAVEREVFGELHDEVFTSLNVLARLHEAKGDFPAARAVRQAVLASRIKRHGEKDWRVTDARLALADCERLAGFDAGSRARYREAEELAAVVDQRSQEGRWREAVALAKKVVALRRDLLGEAHPAYAESFHTLASLYRALGDYRQALPLYEQARDIRKKALGPDHPDYAVSLNNLALLYEVMGDYQKALPLAEEARDIAKKALGPDRPGYAASLAILASLYYSQGKPGEAAPLLHQVLAITRTFLDRTLAVQSDRQRLRFLHQQRRTLNAYLSVAPAAPVPAEALYEAVLAWKGALAARQAEERAARSRPDLLPTLEQLRQARAGLARLYQQQPATAAQRADWLKRFQEFEARKEQREVELAGVSDTYRRFRDLRTATAAQVAQALPPGTALLDFVQYTHYTPPPMAKDRSSPKRGCWPSCCGVASRRCACLWVLPTPSVTRRGRGGGTCWTSEKTPSRPALLWRSACGHRWWAPWGTHARC